MDVDSNRSLASIELWSGGRGYGCGYGYGDGDGYGRGDGYGGGHGYGDGDGHGYGDGCGFELRIDGDDVHIGCQEMTAEEWLGVSGENVADEHGYPMFARDLLARAIKKATQ